MATADRLHELYERMYDRLGPQGWWPGDSPFEVMVGAVLTQNTNWKNVERAIDKVCTVGRTLKAGTEVTFGFADK